MDPGWCAVMTRVGFIGTGSMGLPMCANLVCAGFDVTAADKRPDRQAPVLRCGARWALSPAGAAADAGFLITMLPGAGAVTEVMTGAGGVLGALSAGAVWIDMTSNSPAAGRALVAAARARGIDTLDAPVGGGIAAARAGTLQIFAGGDREVLDRSRPVLEALAGTGCITHAGGTGAGYITKLLVNLLWFGQAIATAEALLTGVRAGLDIDTLHQVLGASAGSSAFIRDDLCALLDGDYLASFGLDRCWEELAAITQLARDLAVPCQLTGLVEDTYQQALRRFGPVKGELLPVALLEEQAGLKLRREPR